MKPPALFRLACLILSVLVAGCARPAYEARGLASYVADHYAGHLTSSGQVYRPEGYTAAHNSLPFGTEVKVRNNYNGRSVKVIVNDRFPNYPNRLINLSSTAAWRIQIPYMQMADVTVTAKTIPGQQARPSGAFSQNAPTPPHPGHGVPPQSRGTRALPDGLPPAPAGYPDLR